MSMDRFIIPMVLTQVAVGLWMSALMHSPLGGLVMDPLMKPPCFGPWSVRAKR